MRGLPPKARTLLLAIQATDGGPGSGNFNHSGRPGLVGGSGEGGGSTATGSSGGAGKRLLTELPDIKSPEYKKLYNESIESESNKAFYGLQEGVKQPFKPTELMNEVRAKLGLEPYQEYKGDDPDDLQAAYDYTYKGDGRMNKLLRQSALTPEESGEWDGQLDKTLDQIKRLDRLMELPENTTKEPGILFRGYDNSEVFLNAIGVKLKRGIGKSSLSTLRKALIGHTFSDPGFVSTSMNIEGITQHSEEFHLCIYCPPGTKGINLHPISHYRKEHEFLLQRGSQFVVTGVSVEGVRELGMRSDSYQYSVHVALVSQNPSEIPSDYAK